MSQRSAFEEALGSLGRRIDAALDALRERIGHVRNRLATGPLTDRRRGPWKLPRVGTGLHEALAAVRDRLQDRRAGPGLLLGAFAAGAGLVALVMLVLVLGFGLFRGTGLTQERLEVELRLQRAIERAQNQRDGVLNPTAMLMHGTDPSQATPGSAQTDTSGDDPKAPPRGLRTPGRP